jgi:SHS2 domain-containing protein
MTPPQLPAGFQELPHTADVALRVWAPDNDSLFTQAALGLNAIAGVRMSSQREVRGLALQQTDLASLLVEFLSELVFLQENEHLAFDKFDIEVTGQRAGGMLEGAEILSLERPIKAVTFHNLRILSTEGGLEVDVVFDV